MDSEEARIYSAILISAAVLACIFIYFFVSIVRQQHRNASLQKANNTAEITAMEKERSRIAADLHDEIAPYLTAIKIKVADSELNDHASGEHVEQTIDHVLNRIREISFDLMPTVLLRKGLFAGIRELIFHINESYNISIALVADENLKIPEQKAVHIFRVVHEVLHNAIKHSKATEVLIVFEKQEHLFVLKIADNGIGFDYGEKLKENNGFGLRSIQNRIDLVGGTTFVKTGRGKGLSYVFEFKVEDFFPGNTG
jgi:signal transduction histidine kinase